MLCFEDKLGTKTSKCYHGYANID